MRRRKLNAQLNWSAFAQLAAKPCRKPDSQEGEPGAGARSSPRPAPPALPCLPRLPRHLCRFTWRRSVLPVSVSGSRQMLHNPPHPPPAAGPAGADNAGGDGGGNGGGLRFRRAAVGRAGGGWWVGETMRAPHVCLPSETLRPLPLPELLRSLPAPPPHFRHHPPATHHCLRTAYAPLAPAPNRPPSSSFRPPSPRHRLAP